LQRRNRRYGARDVGGVDAGNDKAQRAVAFAVEERAFAGLSSGCKVGLR
jgi:hypothetical protein